MLDSLVRVSRRVGQVTDRFASDPEPVAPLGTAVRPRSAGTENSPRQSRRTHGAPATRPAALESLPRSDDGPYDTRVCNTAPLRARPPSPGASDRRRTGPSAPPAGSAPVDVANDPNAPLADATNGPTRRRRIESDGRTLRSSPFASKRFHVLLNSLFKVLFNFPSRYLFAIGLVSVFSLRWSLPPTLGCIIKQPDSEDVAGSDGAAP
jgi:hypothetical protein